MTGCALAVLLGHFFRIQIREPALKAVAAARVEAQTAGRLAPAIVRHRSGDLRIPGATELVSTSKVRALETHGGFLWMATSGGLLRSRGPGGLEFTTADRITALTGLPENNLTSLAVHDGDLWIGTASSGLVRLQGDTLVSYRFPAPAANRITSLCSSRNRLLIGTFGAGLIALEDGHFKTLSLKISGGPVQQVSALVATESGFVVATPEQGLVVRDSGGQAEPEERPRQITGLFHSRGRLLIGTPYGLHSMDRRLIMTTLLPDIHVTALEGGAGGAVLIGTMEGALYRLPSEPDGAAGRPLSQVVPDEAARRPVSQPWKRLQAPILSILFISDAVVAGTSTGAFRISRDRVQALDLPSDLPHPHVSALALGGEESVWVGFFEGGVRRLQPAPSLVPGLEDCPGVNHLRWDLPTMTMDVATLHGVIRHDGYTVQRRLRKADGLIGENVAFSLRVPAGRLYGTEKGITVEQGGRLFSLTGFQGLPSNHIYTGARLMDRVRIGTLGGLADLADDRVVATYTAGTTALPAAWVTVVHPVAGGCWIGTYGGGPVLLGNDGTFSRPAELPAGREINANAVARVLLSVAFGTLDGILLLPLDSRGPSRLIVEGLGHPDVTALLATSTHLLVGTEAGLTRIPLEFFN